MPEGRLPDYQWDNEPDWNASMVAAFADRGIKTEAAVKAWAGFLFDLFAEQQKGKIGQFP